MNKCAFGALVRRCESANYTMGRGSRVTVGQREKGQKGMEIYEIYLRGLASGDSEGGCSDSVCSCLAES